MTSRPRAHLRGQATVTVAMAVMNVANYGYTIVAARLLGPRQYGGFGAAIGLVLVLAVVQLGVQTTGARRVAADPTHAATIERSVLGLTYRAAAVLGIALLVLSPLVQRALHLESLVTAVLLAVTVVALTIMGGQAGILQGGRRWVALAAVYVVSAVPRVVIGTGLLAWRPREAVTMIGVALGLIAAVGVGWWVIRAPRTLRSREDEAAGAGVHARGSVLREIVHNSHALLAFLALSNADVILARGVLDRHDAGLYAGGVILVKAVLFLPQFVVVIAFPAMSTAGPRRGAVGVSLGVVVVLGAVGTIATAGLSGLALAFIGGDDYAEIRSLLWRFALVGTLLSLIQLLVYGAVARQSRLAVYAVWAGLVVIAVGATMQDSVGGLLTLVTVIDAVTLVALLGISLRPRRTAAAQ